MLYQIINNTAVAWAGEPINDVRHPLSIENLWTENQLNEVGLYKLVAADAIPDGKEVVSSTISIVNGRPKRVNTLQDIPALNPADYVLTARQIRLGLIRNNVALSVVQTAINAIPDQETRDEAQVYWEFSNAIVWTHPMTQALLALSGIDANSAAQMWLVAKDYEA